MDPLYTKRLLNFFVKSIVQLKGESGGQRWNAICEDTAQLFVHVCERKNQRIPYTQFQLWQMFFEPDNSHDMIEILCEEIEVQSIFFLCLQALLDPPSSWWKLQFQSS